MASVMENVEGKSLPEDIVDAILLRLPCKSLKRFECVCKRWHSSITSSSFIKRYNAHRSSTKYNDGKMICFRKDPDTKAHVVSILDHQTTKTIEELKFPPFVDDGLETKDDEENSVEFVRDYEFHRDIHMLGPVNGVYCIYHRLIERWGGTLVLWNPSTREYKHIHPRISFPFSPSALVSLWRLPHQVGDPDVGSPESFDIGFGFDCSINDYKIVVICGWDNLYGYFSFNWHVSVYNNATDSWKTLYSLTNSDDSPVKNSLQLIGDAPFPTIDSYPDFTNCFLDGVSHWSCATHEYLGLRTSESLVLAFDMAKESFELSRGPPISRFDYNHRSLWVCRETLAMVAVSSKKETVEVWMMMEYGVEKSWALLYLIGVGPIQGFRVAGIPYDERIFFANNDAQLISHGLYDHEVKEHGVYGVYDTINVNLDHGSSYYGSFGVLKYVENLAPIKPMGNHEQQCPVEVRPLIDTLNDLV